MQQIKFRAYDTQLKKWYQDHAIYINGRGDVYVPNEDDDSVEAPPDVVKVMLFTGLQDSNGKDIYAGDIVRLFDARKGMSGDGTPMLTYVDCVVVWDESDLGWRARYVEYNNLFCAGSTSSWYCYRKQVIGNIYDNPELIKWQS